MEFVNEYKGIYPSKVNNFEFDSVYVNTTSLEKAVSMLATQYGEEPTVCTKIHDNVLIESANADLEDNHETIIDVSTYTEPIEITPIEDKDGMRKVTVSLSNMPAGANMLYAWEEDGKNPNTFYFGFEVAPTTLAEFQTKKILYGGELGVIQEETCENASDFERTSDTEFNVDIRGGLVTNFTRNPTYDVEVWNAPPEVETTKQATIDVSTYDPANKPVITPTAGKQSMTEVEITLSNIPAGVNMLYGWVDGDNFVSYFDFNVAPSDKAEYNTKKHIEINESDNSIMVAQNNLSQEYIYEKSSDGEFSIGDDSPKPVEIIYTRDATKDVEIWNTTNETIPSLEYPSWLIMGDEMNSVVPMGVYCVVYYNDSNIIIGDGESTLGELLNSFGENVYFDKIICSYGESAVIEYYADK